MEQGGKGKGRYKERDARREHRGSARTTNTEVKEVVAVGLVATGEEESRERQVRSC